MPTTLKVSLDFSSTKDSSNTEDLTNLDKNSIVSLLAVIFLLILDAAAYVVKTYPIFLTIGSNISFLVVAATYISFILSRLESYDSIPLFFSNFILSSGSSDLLNPLYIDSNI